MARNPFEINRTARPAPNVGRDLDIARSKREFFGNNPGVSDDRALRRITQFDKDVAFKNQFTRPVQGSSNLLQMTSDAPRSLAAERMRLANVYGPTPREIMGDMGRGIGSMFRGSIPLSIRLVGMIQKTLIHWKMRPWSIVMASFSKKQKSLLH